MAEITKSKMRNFKDWLVYEKEDLKDGLFVYPKRKILFLFLGILILLGIIFKLWAVISSNTIEYWDDFLVSPIKQLKNPCWDNFFSGLTILGSEYFVVLAFLALTVFLVKKRRKRAAVTVFLTLIGSNFLIFLFKNIFNRTRPNACFDDFGQYGCLSFPSGHATRAFYFYGILFYLIARFGGLKKPFVLLLGVGLTGLISLIGLSRVYLGFHFPTDVMAGFLLGGIFLLAGIILIDFFYQTK